ncbi:hypothetical protein GE09DRAFT_590069 [Coniochaeta sp. 2T2.1]|nr:hypothetical protein GE09DRAFT_590069 [Coniochaeta sp. 2T2.1]
MLHSWLVLLCIGLAEKPGQLSPTVLCNQSMPIRSFETVLSNMRFMVVVGHSYCCCCNIARSKDCQVALNGKHTVHRLLLRPC